LLDRGIEGVHIDMDNLSHEAPVKR
jgi:hypothetical protein